VRALSWATDDNAQSERMIRDQRTNPSFIVGAISGVSETEEGRHSLFSVSVFGFWRLKWFDILFSDQWSIIYSNFLTGAYFLLLTPSLVTENFGLGVVCTFSVSSEIPPQALGSLQRSPDSPAGRDRARGTRYSSPQEPQPPLSALLFSRRVSRRLNDFSACL